MIDGVVKNAGHGVVILGGDGVVFVIVAARTGDGQAKKSARHGIHAVVALVGVRDFDRAVVVKPWTETEEAKSREHLGAHSVIERIGGDLRGDELVVRQVVIERLDHPVAIQIGAGVGIVAAAHGIETAVVVLTIARDVEPHATPALAVLGRCEQAVNHFGERIRCRVFLKCVNLFGRGRQTGEIERNAAYEGPAVSQFRGGHPLLLEPRQNESVDGGLRPSGIFDSRRRGIVNWLERPECTLLGPDHVATGFRGDHGRGFGPQCAGLYPLGESVDVFLFELAALGHFELARLADGQDQQTFVRIAGHDRGAGLAAFQQGRARVHPQPAELRIGMAGVAAGRQDGTDFGFEKVGRGCGLCRRRLCTNQAHGNQQGKRGQLQTGFVHMCLPVSLAILGIGANRPGTLKTHSATRIAARAAP